MAGQSAEFMVPSIMEICPSPEAAPDHYITTTIFDSWYDVLFMKCCVGFMPDATGNTPFVSHLFLNFFR